MAEVEWGQPRSGVRFGLRPPPGEVEAGGTVMLELFCENRTDSPVRVFGFEQRYPRSLRVSPPKEARPWIRVSFGDVNVLHPPEAFTQVLPGGLVSTGLDLSFAFDRRGAGKWSVAFAYDPVRSAGGVKGWQPEDGQAADTGIAEFVVTRARSLREAGIDERAEMELDGMLMQGHTDVVDRLRSYGPGGAAFAARRVARVLSPSAEAIVGWRALDALEALGPPGLAAARQAEEELPHAAEALRYAGDYIEHRLGHPPPDEHLPFVTMLDRVIDEADSRGNVTIAWTSFDSPVHGSRRLEVFGNGDRVVIGRAPEASVTSTRRSRLRPMAMHTMLKALRYGAVWLLRPLRATGMPDEPRPALEVQLALGEPFARQVALWNGEWRYGPGSNLASLLDRLAQEAVPDSLRPPPGE